LKSLEPTGDENALLPEENPTEEAGEEESAVLSEEESESAIASTSYLFTKTFSEDRQVQKISAVPIPLRSFRQRLKLLK